MQQSHHVLSGKAVRYREGQINDLRKSIDRLAKVISVGKPLPLTGDLSTDLSQLEGSIGKVGVAFDKVNLRLNGIVKMFLKKEALHIKNLSEQNVKNRSLNQKFSHRTRIAAASDVPSEMIIKTIDQSLRRASNLFESFEALSDKVLGMNFLKNKKILDQQLQLRSGRIGNQLTSVKKESFNKNPFGLMYRAFLMESKKPKSKFLFVNIWRNLVIGSVKAFAKTIKTKISTFFSDSVNFVTEKFLNIFRSKDKKMKSSFSDYRRGSSEEQLEAEEEAYTKMGVELDSIYNTLREYLNYVTNSPYSEASLQIQNEMRNQLADLNKKMMDDYKLTLSNYRQKKYKKGDVPLTDIRENKAAFKIFLEEKFAPMFKNAKSRLSSWEMSNARKEILGSRFKQIRVGNKVTDELTSQQPIDPKKNPHMASLQKFFAQSGITDPQKIASMVEKFLKNDKNFPWIGKLISDLKDDPVKEAMLDSLKIMSSSSGIAKMLKAIESGKNLKPVVKELIDLRAKKDPNFGKTQEEEDVENQERLLEQKNIKILTEIRDLMKGKPSTNRATPASGTSGKGFLARTKQLMQTIISGGILGNLKKIGGLIASLFKKPWPLLKNSGSKIFSFLKRRGGLVALVIASLESLYDSVMHQIKMKSMGGLLGVGDRVLTFIRDFTTGIFSNLAGAMDWLLGVFGFETHMKKYVNMFFDNIGPWISQLGGWLGRKIYDIWAPVFGEKKKNEKIGSTPRHDLKKKNRSAKSGGAIPPPVQAMLLTMNGGKNEKIGSTPRHRSAKSGGAIPPPVRAMLLTMNGGTPIPNILSLLAEKKSKDNVDTILGKFRVNSGSEDESKHRSNSLHYEDRALDLAPKNFIGQKRSDVISEKDLKEFQAIHESLKYLAGIKIYDEYSTVDDDSKFKNVFRHIHVEALDETGKKNLEALIGGSGLVKGHVKFGSYDKKGEALREELKNSKFIYETNKAATPDVTVNVPPANVSVPPAQVSIENNMKLDSVIMHLLGVAKYSFLI